MNLAVGTVGGKLSVSAAMDLPPKIGAPSQADALSRVAVQQTACAPAR